MDEVLKSCPKHGNLGRQGVYFCQRCSDEAEHLLAALQLRARMRTTHRDVATQLLSRNRYSL